MPRHSNEPLYYYVDSDFLPNYGTSFDNRRSTTGYCAFLAGACAHHSSRRQSTVATSTAHAEYLAAFEAATFLRVLAFLSLAPRLCLRTTNSAFACPRKTTHLHACNTLMRGIIGCASKWFTPAPFVLFIALPKT